MQQNPHTLCALESSLVHDVKDLGPAEHGSIKYSINKVPTVLYNTTIFYRVCSLFDRPDSFVSV